MARRARAIPFSWAFLMKLGMVIHLQSLIGVYWNNWQCKELVMHVFTWQAYGWIWSFLEYDSR